jgi:rubredoxin
MAHLEIRSRWLKGGEAKVPQIALGVKVQFDRASWQNAPLIPTTHCGDEMKKYMCVICGFIYDEAKGLPDEGIAPGTRWEDVPLNWACPECGAGKEDFEMMEI